MLTKAEIYRRAAATLQIVNASLSGTLGVNINLEDVDSRSAFLKKMVSFSPAVWCRLAKTPSGWVAGYTNSEADEKLTVLIFSSGKFICAGIRSILEVEKAFEPIIAELRKLGLNPVLSWQIQNINFTGHFPARLNMRAFKRKWPCVQVNGVPKPLIEYEPRLFPGGRFHYPSGKKCSLEFFASGKFNIAGTRYQSLQSAFQMARKVLKAFVDIAPRKAFIFSRASRA